MQHASAGATQSLDRSLNSLLLSAIAGKLHVQTKTQCTAWAYGRNTQLQPCETGC